MGAAATDPTRPLAGVSVVDMSTSYAGPTASMYLADMGADVIKVERPRTGDDARHWGPPFVADQSAWFVSANRNKRSICISLSSPEGREVLDRLLRDANVFIESMNPAKLAQLGLDPDELRQRHPHLVYCAVSGFGLTGPDSSLPGYDLVAQARSGMMSVTGASPDSPQRVSTALSDIASAMVAAFSITAAVRHQERTGEGTLVDVSLLDVDLALMAPRIASYLAGEPEPVPCGATDSVLAVYQTFAASDRSLVLAVGNDRLWVRMCNKLGLEDLAVDPDLANNAGRRQHRERLVTRLEETFATRPAAHWIKLLGEAGVPCALVSALSEVVADPQVAAREAIVGLPVADEVEMSVVSSPWRFDGAGSQDASPPPHLGGDTRALLTSLGYSQDEQRAMLEREAVWEPTT